ncbi:MAG: 30S ribosomal protein S17 [Planctomycetota bacterium]|jgi:small subunit ribosomal protein S17|nr:30S ribosomal protein S17 [Planctomycetota bacterium]
MAAAVKKKVAVKQAGGLSGTRQGVVDSDSRDQTRRVVINYLTMHPKYGKFVRQRSILQVHDAKNEARAGDVVEIAPCRPISKSKRWTLVRVVERRADQAAAIKSVATLQS